MPKLTAKQKAFCDKYIECKNATESAKFAGYSEKTAYSQGQRLLKNVEVRKYVDEKLKKESEDLGITFEWVANALKKNYELALTPDGETGRIDVRASSDALKELNKMFGHNAPEKREISSEVKIVPDFGDGGDDL